MKINMLYCIDINVICYIVQIDREVVNKYRYKKSVKFYRLYINTKNKSIIAISWFILFYYHCPQIVTCRSPLLLIAYQQLLTTTTIIQQNAHNPHISY